MTTSRPRVVSGPVAVLPPTIIGVVVLVSLAAGGAVQRATAESTLQSWLSGEGATGDWFGYRSRLSDHGFTPYAVWTGEVFRNFDGGLKRGTDLEGLLEFGADIDLGKTDLGKAMGWHGANIHLSGLWIQSSDDPSADLVGNFNEVSNIAGREALRFYEFYLALAFGEGEFNVKLGQLVFDDDFMVSDGSSLFLNASFGAMPIESADIHAPIYPIAALGGFARWIPGNGASLQIGIYAGDPGTEESNESGFDYTLGSSEGVVLLAEAAIDTALLGRDGTYKLGGYYHSGRFTDLDSGNTEWGNYGLYVMLDQVLVGTRDSNRLAAFLRAGISPLDDRSEVDWYLDAGLSTRGLCSQDRVGLGFSHSHFGDDFVSAQQLAGSRVTHAESLIELTYRAQLTPWWVLQLDLQYVFNPQVASASDALVGGIRAEITF